MARTFDRGAASKIISRGGGRRIGPVQFIQETVTELRKAVWPTREETTRLTVYVLLLCVAVGIILWLVDRGFGLTFSEVIFR